MKIMFRTFGVAVMSVALMLTTGCVNPNGTQNNTGSGALIGGALGAITGAIIGHNNGNAGAGALIGAAAGMIAGAIAGHITDQINAQQRAQLQDKSPQTLQTVQHNDYVYQQQHSSSQPPAPAQPSPLAANLDSGLIAYYPFNGNANDASGNGRNGTLQNSPTFVAGPVSGAKALHLIGQGYCTKDGQYVTIPSIELSGLSAFTLSLWADIEGITSPNDGEFVLGIGDDCPDMTHVVGICYGVNGAGTFNISFHAGNVDINPSTQYSTQWHRYSMAYLNRVLTTYVDGQVIGTTNCSIASTAGDAGMGIHWWCNNPYGVSTRFIGSLADVRIYNRALSPSEIAKLAQSSPQSPAPTQTTETPTPLTVDDIKALSAAGVKVDVIKEEIGESKAVYSPADIDAAQQAHVNEAVIDCMKSHASS